MKKFLFTFLVVFNVFMIAGCSDSDDGDGITTPTMSNLSSLQGTYDIQFFYADAQVAALTTDCSKVTTYVGEDARECKNPNTDSVQHYGEATIKVNDDGSVKVLSKVQINGGAFETIDLVKQQAADRVYNFTEYKTVPSDAISETTINDEATGKAVKGTYGRSATQLIDATKSDNNTFYFTVEGGIVVNRLTDVTIMPADTVIRMKKKSDNVITLDPNTPYNKPAIDNFNTSVTYELKNN